MVGRAESVYVESVAIIAFGGKIVSGASDIGLVATKEWASGDFSAYTC